VFACAHAVPGGARGVLAVPRRGGEDGHAGATTCAAPPPCSSTVPVPRHGEDGGKTPRRRSPPQRTGGRAPPRPLTASFGVDLRDGFNFVLTAVRGYAQHLLLLSMATDGPDDEVTSKVSAQIFITTQAADTLPK
jgi:hypothetical protein